MKFLQYLSPRYLVEPNSSVGAELVGVVGLPLLDVQTGAMWPFFPQV